MGSLHDFRRFVGDSLTNLVNGIGSSKDSRSYSRYTLDMLMRPQLEAAYRGDWLARTIVDAPAEDATREWRSWQTENATIEKLEAAEKQYDLQRKLKRALILARLYGGSAIVMGVNQGKADEPLDIERVKKDGLRFIEVFHQFELTPGQRIRDIESPWFNQPEYYQLGAAVTSINKKDATPGVQIHPSRVIALVGHEIPDVRMHGTAQWGDSVLQVVDEAIKATGTVVGGIASMIADAKMDVIKIPGLSKQLSDEQLSSKLIERFTVANQMKSMVNTLLLDEKENWERVQTSFAALPDLLEKFIAVAAGAARIPVTRLIGESRGGLGSSTSGGEVDLRNYYDDISSMQRNELSPTLTPLDEVFIRSVLGHEDENLYYEWTPLWQMSDGEKAEIANKKAVTTQADVTMALINPDVLREARINQLIEDGTYPGIEDAIEEFGSEPEEPEEPTPEDMEAHIGMMQKSAGTLNKLAAPAMKALPKPTAAKDEFLADYNKNHEPAGSEKGGQFAKKEGGGETGGKPYGGGPGGHETENLDTSSTPASNLLTKNFDEANDTFDKVMAKLTPPQIAEMEKLEKEMSAMTPTKDQFSVNGVYTDERANFHDEVIRKKLSRAQIKAAMPAEGEQPTLVLTGGRPAAGKTSSLRSELGEEKKGEVPKSVYISADDLQEEIPGYQGGHAGIYNGEGQDMAEKLEHAARALGLNITFDATMKSTQPAHERVDLYRKEGYRVHGYFVHTTPVESAKRSYERFERSGRYVPLKVAFNSRTNEATFDSLIPKLDKWAVYDNNGKKPRRVAHGGS